MSGNKMKSKAARIADGCLAVAVLLYVLTAILGMMLEEGAFKTVCLAVSGLMPVVLLVVAVVWVILNWVTVKEFLRKFVVSLKRNPSMIPLVMLFVAFLFYSFNLTNMSDTTAKIQGAGMGLSQFCIMLFSLLSLVCLLNAFPKRKKANIPMVVLMFVMFAVIIYCEIHYQNAIFAALNRAESPIVLDKNTQYIADAYNMLSTHTIMMIVTAVLVVTLPVYSKLLKKINTSVEVEDNGNMAQIEISED